jgi:hypothetical protein
MNPLILKIAMPPDLEEFAEELPPETGAALESAWMQRSRSRFELIMFPLRFDAKRDKYTGDGCPPFRETVALRFNGLIAFDDCQLEELAAALLEGRKVTPDYVYKYRAARAAERLLTTLFS